MRQWEVDDGAIDEEKSKIKTTEEGKIKDEEKEREKSTVNKTPHGLNNTFGKTIATQIGCRT